MEWYIWALSGLLLAGVLSAPFIAKQVREYRLQRAGLGDLSLMTDDAMRLHMIRLLNAMGYRVFGASFEQDGFDLILLDGLGQKRGVLLQTWRQPVDETVVAKAAEAAKAQGIAAPMIVTVEYYTYKARRAAERSGVILWSVGDLTRAIGQIRQTAGDSPQLPTPERQSSPPADEPKQSEAAKAALAVLTATREELAWQSVMDDTQAPKCPRCGMRMQVKRHKQGTYWACRAFPRCLGTLSRD